LNSDPSFSQTVTPGTLENTSRALFVVKLAMLDNLKLHFFTRKEQFLLFQVVFLDFVALVLQQHFLRVMPHFDF
jgi:hypothetical protein